MRDASLDFLRSIITAPSPSGFEEEVAELYRSYVSLYVDRITTDVLGNVTAIINPEAKIRFMFAGHMDEIGFIVHYIDENGFLFFNAIGGIDVATEVGQRVWVLGEYGKVPGSIGRKAIQTFKGSDASETPPLTDLWIDIGAGSREEAEQLVTIGSPVVLQGELELLAGRRALGRAFDNKIGLFIAAETLRRLHEEGGVNPDVGVYVLGTVQEEIGSGGRRPQLSISRPIPASPSIWAWRWITRGHNPSVKESSIWEAVRHC